MHPHHSQRAMTLSACASVCPDRCTAECTTFGCAQWPLLCRVQVCDWLLERPPDCGLQSPMIMLCICQRNVHRCFAHTALGAFSHSAGTAPIITLFIPGTPLKNIPLQKHAQSFQNSIGGAEFRTLGPVASIRLQKKDPWCTSRRCRVQNSGPWDPWLPAAENS